MQAGRPDLWQKPLWYRLQSPVIKWQARCFASRTKYYVRMEFRESIELGTNPTGLVSAAI